MVDHTLLVAEKSELLSKEASSPRLRRSLSYRCRNDAELLHVEMTSNPDVDEYCRLVAQCDRCQLLLSVQDETLDKALERLKTLSLLPPRFGLGAISPWRSR